MKYKTKLGINSGNSFKLGSLKSLHNHQARHQHVIIKTFKNREFFGEEALARNQKICENAARVCDDGGLEHNKIHVRAHNWWTEEINTIYSLNKRKRWLLPTLIEKAIDQLVELKNEQGQTPDKNELTNFHSRNRLSDVSSISNNLNFELSLVERAIPSSKYENAYFNQRRVLQNTCTTYHNSFLSKAHVTAKHQYAFENELKNKAKDDEKEKYEKSKRFIRARQRHAHHNENWHGTNNHYCKNKKTRKRREQNNDAQNPNENNDLPAWLLNAHNPNGAFVPGDQDEKNPLFHYEVCYPLPVLGHHDCFDQGHKQQYTYSYQNRLGNQTKAFKKCKSLCKHHIIGNRFAIDSGVDAFQEESGNRQKISEALLEEMNEAREWQLYQELEEVSTPVNELSIADFIDIAFEKKKNDSKCKRKRHKKRKTEAVVPNFHAFDDVRNVTSGSVNGSIPDTISSDYSEDDDFVILAKSLSDDSEINFENTYDAFDMFSTKLSPTSVVLRRDSIDVESLRFKYGENYLECNMLPRSFVIHLTDIIISNMTECDKGRQFQKKGNICLVFEEAKVETNTDETKEFRVHTEGNVDVEIMKTFQNQIESLVLDKRKSVINIDSLISYVVQTEALFDFPDTEKNTKYLKTWHHGSHQLMEKFCSISASSHTLDEAFTILNEEMSAEASTIMNEESAVQDVSEPLQSMQRIASFVRTLSRVEPRSFCDICYDNLITQEDEGIDMCCDFTGIALASCQHWFCRQCWQRHLLERIRIGDIRIQCPGFDCDKLIDKASLLLLLPYTYYEKYLRILRDAMIEKSLSWKWCPNNVCGKVVKVSSSKGKNISESTCVNVVCHCGQSWCFACQKESHWPSTCQQATSYFKMIKQKGDGRIVGSYSFYVDVKKCPFCRYPIEKSSGCQHMNCSRCRGEFCWACLGAWKEHSMMLKCPKAFVGTDTVEIDNTSSVKLNEYYLDMAMGTRRKRKELTWLVPDPEVRLKSLAVKMRRYQLRKGNVSYKVMWRKGRTSYWDTEKIANITEAWTLMIEALVLMEQTYVILSNSTKKARRPALIWEVDRLTFILNMLHEVFTSQPKSNIGKMIQKIDVLVHHGKECALLVISKLCIAQRGMSKQQNSVS